MTMAYRFAHLTDPHLPLHAADMRPGAGLVNKRLSGALSWRFKRRSIHLPEILARTAADIHAHQPGHIVLTGDLVNISLPREFERAALWLSALGAPENVSVTPGNHDAYVKSSATSASCSWAAYMQGDAGNGKVEFPYCRIREEIAFIGLSTAAPTPLFSATGRIGAEQIAELGPLLERMGRAGMMRVVMLHHPPGVAGNSRRKGLQDREALRQVIARHGAELILHGHTHRAGLDHLSGPRGPVPVLAPSSASALDPHGENARWHLLEAERAAGGGWRIGVTVRGLDGQGQFQTGGRFYLRGETLNTAG